MVFGTRSILNKVSFLFWSVGVCSLAFAQESPRIYGLEFSYSATMQSKLMGELPYVQAFQDSEFLVVEGKQETGFKLGEFKQTDTSGIATGSNGRWQRSVESKLLPDLPGARTIIVRWKNISTKPLKVTEWGNHRYGWGKQTEEVWGYYPSSHESRPNWMRQVKQGEKSTNYTGMNNSDYGGGTPLTALWTKKGGLAVGSAETVPMLLQFPIERKAEARLWVGEKREVLIQPGEEFVTPRTFVMPFQGDAYVPLRALSLYLQSNGWKMPATNMKHIGPLWCAWGYGRDFSVEQVKKTLPIVKEMGFLWVGIDDGWQKAIGDWELDPKKFPNGEKDMKDLVDEIHKLGMKAQLWWAPLAAHPSSQMYKENQDWLIRNVKNEFQEITWWDSKYLCPDYGPVQDHTNGLVKKFLQDWGFDGLKIDGQHLNGSPECTAPSHKHPHLASAAVNHHKLFEGIFQTAIKINPNALVETCPCGTSYSVFNLPFQNLTVASDPEGSDQVRQKGKFIRALTGDAMVYFGDHVELSDGRSDFASSMGIGALVGTNFTLPGVLIEKPKGDEHDTRLYDDKKKVWAKWITLAKEKKLWEGEYLGAAYDLAFDRPEAHAVRKEGNLYYGFYQDNFSGKLELRGLSAGKKYQVRDYENNKDYGVVIGPSALLVAKFKGHLLLEALETVE